MQKGGTDRIAKPKKKRLPTLARGLKKSIGNRKRYLKFSLNKSINKSH
jgi:Sec-independent protein translocase protein TatA